jgi:anti-anti-sigma regulatory factor
MKFYLIVTKGKHKGMPLPITVDLFMIGSGKECQLRCKKREIPEELCALVTRETKVFVRDLHSRCPVLVNSALVPPGEEWPLHKGDLLQVGKLEFMLQFREKPLSQRDLEEWALGCLDTACSREFEDPDELLITERVRKATTPAQAAASILDRLALRRGEIHGRLRVGQEGPVTVIRFNDRHLVDESEISLIHKDLHEHLNRPNLRVLLDCKNVKRMSTAAAMMMDELCTWLKPWGSTLALCRIRPELQRAFRGLPLTNHLPQFPDKPSALAARW